MENLGPRRDARWRYKCCELRTSCNELAKKFKRSKVGRNERKKAFSSPKTDDEHALKRDNRRIANREKLQARDIGDRTIGSTNSGSMERS
jgi:hypothetical protein